MANWRTHKLERARAYAAEQRGVTRCLWCRWKFRGLLGEGKRLHELHVRHKHRKLK